MQILSIAASPTWFNILSDIGKRALAIGLERFPLIINGSVLAYGGEEIAFNCWPLSPASTPLIAKIEIVKKKQLLVHGVCYAISGGLGLVSSLTSGALSSISGTSGWAFFIAANLYALEKNVKLYELAEQIPEEQGKRLKASAAMGMINTLGYLLAAIFSFFPGMLAIVIALTVLALLAGSVKFFFDLFALNNK